MASNGITARRSFHRIWIAGKKSLVKRAPDLPGANELKRPMTLWTEALGSISHTIYELTAQISWKTTCLLWHEKMMTHITSHSFASMQCHMSTSDFTGQFASLINWLSYQKVQNKHKHQSFASLALCAEKLPTRWLHHREQGWGLLSQLLPFRYFPNFSAFSKHTLDIEYHMNICHRSWAAATPVKYEFDLKNLKENFARSKILLMEKLTNGALVTPHPRRAVSI